MTLSFFANVFYFDYFPILVCMWQGTHEMRSSQCTTRELIRRSLLESAAEMSEMNRLSQERIFLQQKNHVEQKKTKMTDGGKRRKGRKGRKGQRAVTIINVRFSPFFPFYLLYSESAFFRFSFGLGGFSNAVRKCKVSLSER